MPSNFCQFEKIGDSSPLPVDKISEMSDNVDENGEKRFSALDGSHYL